MSETEQPPPPAPLPEMRTDTKPVPVAEVKPAPTPPKPAARRSLWPILGIIGFLVLAAGEGYLYRLHQLIPDTSTPIAVLQAQVTSLQQYAIRAQPAPDSVTVQAGLAQKFADLNAQVAALTTQSATDHATLASLAATNTDLAKITAKMTLLSRLESARMALDAGEPLGDIPGSPPALAKFATANPPIEADLLLNFPAAARAADLASVEKRNGVSYWSRVRARLEGLITITDGSRVIIGPPAAAIVEQARQRLEAGDLNGAVAELGNLSPTTQAAMGAWLQQARDLLAARNALIALADKS